MITDVYLILNGTIIPNHGYVAISDIGSTDESALLCHTNQPPAPNKTTSGGDWFAPDETKVDGTSFPGLANNRGSMVVRLKRTTGSPMAGIYKCTIKHSESDVVFKNVYVGLYNNTNKGRIKLCAEVVKFSYVSNCFPQVLFK